MLVAVLSDAHDNIWNVAKVMPRLQEAGALLFLGDFCAPFTLQALAAGFSGPIHCILGNNDGDALLLSQVAGRAPHVRLHQAVGVIELDGKKIAIAHYPQVGEALARSGLYDAVFSGHTHERKVERFGHTLWANPGEVMGRFGQPSFGLYDTATGEFRFVEV